MIDETTPCPPEFPDHLWDSFKRYVLEGRPTGQFLEALFAGDLFEVFRRGDEKSLAGVPQMVIYLENGCPAGCYGSRDRVQEWMGQGGLSKRVV